MLAYIEKQRFPFSFASHFQRAVSEGELANIADVLAGQFIATEGNTRKNIFSIFASVANLPKIINDT